MKLFPESTIQQLEFDKVKDMLAGLCRTALAKEQALNLRIHTKLAFIDQALGEAAEFVSLQQQGLYFPNDFTQDISRDIKLLAIPGASLSGEQFMLINRLAANAQQQFRWFTADIREAYPFLTAIIAENYYEKAIREMIGQVLDESGQVKDNASPELADIRMKLFRKRNELRKVFDRLVSKLNKQGYLADINESFMNGRRVLAVMAEQKRQVKGVLHSESDSRRTSFIEPEETTDLNNDIFSLEYEESREVYRILRDLTKSLSLYAPLLQSYYELAGAYDLVRAKAELAAQMHATRPLVIDKAIVDLKRAYHPLLLIYNNRNNKPTIPLDLRLDETNSILVISGPNAGGKTVTLKTIGLLQIMLQSGLLVPVHPDSTMGVFKQLMIHIGDTQSIEFELSTYSSHLKHMKYFIENANGKTLFFIDELGSGSDPNLGGAFAEVIMEELAFKHAYGIVTTHYLNLKVMANKVKGIINGAMQFDEQNLLPLYKLQVGKPGSSYTFSIAERIGLDKKLIDKARRLVDEDHFRLDKLLNRTEQDLQHIDKEKDQLEKARKENERLKRELEHALRKELHTQEKEKLMLQNKISEEKLAYLKDMERRLRAMVIEWKRSEDKEAAMKTINALLFNQKEKFQKERQQKKINDKFLETSESVIVGARVRLKNSRNVGTVQSIKGKKVVVQVGVIPITVDAVDLVVVKEKTEEGKKD